MEAQLGIATCDKCGEVMKKGQGVLVIAEGVIRKGKQADLRTFWGSCIRYACHMECWDGVEEDE